MSGPPDMILEAALYADGLDEAERFHGGVLGLERIARGGDRHVFFRCGAGVVLIFDPTRSEAADPDANLKVPPQGARGPGHLCFRAEPLGIDAWRGRLERAGVAIESEVAWPRGGRSFRARDAAGNSAEFAEARSWDR